MKRFFIILVTSLLSINGFAFSFTSDNSLSMSDEESLLYMLEEEKLARDVYIELYALWGANQFNNISGSEQDHMDQVEALLIAYEIAYSILPSGEYANSDLQELYYQLMTLGQTSIVDAFVVGMTIEDVDIYDLQVRIAETSNSEIITAYQFLMCGSENHMRAFYNGLTANGGTYSPQFITVEEYNTILNTSSGPCALAIEDYMHPNTKVLSTTLVTDRFSIVLSGRSSIYIYTVNGAMLLSKKVTQNEYISIDNFTSGVYFVKVINDNKSILVKILKD